MNILLVEPGYENKYPPMSLMKISTYHKNRGDIVYFVKGTDKLYRSWDRIYITTLFTFYYTDVLKTIDYYRQFVTSDDHIFVGGIMASLLGDDLKRDTGLKNIIYGRLLSSSMLGFDDNINIDNLPLDYDIFYDCDYNYPAGDNFFSYTTRGCVNHCDFCAVPKLEGPLNVTNNIVEQITTARTQYGDKRNLLLLDNNILGLNPEELQRIVTDLNSLGFVNKENFKYPSQFEILYNAYFRYVQEGKAATSIIQKLLLKLEDLSRRKISQKVRAQIDEKLSLVGSLYEDRIQMILDNIEFFIDVEKFYLYKKPLQRYVDFNQGIDARLLTEEKMRILSYLPIRPFRIAFDSIKYADIYSNAIHLAAKYGIKDFSNYLLYNFKDTPQDLYQRLKINVNLAEELRVHIFSFPMKYESIDGTHRLHVGEHWNAHYLRSIKAILNVSRGVFGGDISFFEKAFGQDEAEFLRIISMPKELQTYRHYYAENGLTRCWETEFNKLNQIEKEQLMNLVSKCNYESTHPSLKTILTFYRSAYLDKVRKVNRIAQ